jgi:protein tyrosine phosphatase (PTP) superfamily phosphohydrolase (DUF442 family)
MQDKPTPADLESLASLVDECEPVLHAGMPVYRPATPRPLTAAEEVQFQRLLQALKNPFQAQCENLARVRTMAQRSARREKDRREKMAFLALLATIGALSCLIIYVMEVRG